MYWHKWFLGRVWKIQFWKDAKGQRTLLLMF